MFAKIENGLVVQYPIFSLQAEFPNLSFPEDGSYIPEGYVRVLHNQPSQQFLHKSVEGTPALQDGVYKQVWNNVPLQGQELQDAITAHTKFLEAQIQASLDAFARTRNYDGILSACTYATSSVPKFASEAARCVNLRDQTWAAAYQVMADVQEGTTPMPETFQDIQGFLPALTWDEPQTSV